MNAARSFYKVFTSVRLAVVLIVVIVLLCLLATLVSQGRPEAWYQARYSPVVFQAVSVQPGGLVTALGRQEATWSLAEGQEAGFGSGYTLRLLSFQFLRYEKGSPREWISTMDVSREGRRLRDSDGNDIAPPSPGDYFEQGDSRWTFAAFQRDGAAWTALFQRYQAGELAETRILRPCDTIGPFTLTGIIAREIRGLKAVRDPGLVPFLAALLLVTAGLGLTFIQKRGDTPT